MLSIIDVFYTLFNLKPKCNQIAQQLYCCQLLCDQCWICKKNFQDATLAQRPCLLVTSNLLNSTKKLCIVGVQRDC